MLVLASSTAKARVPDVEDCSRYHTSRLPEADASASHLNHFEAELRSPAADIA